MQTRLPVKFFRVEQEKNQADKVDNLHQVLENKTGFYIPEYNEAYFWPAIEAYWKTLPITVRDPDLLTDKKY